MSRCLAVWLGAFQPNHPPDIRYFKARPANYIIVRDEHGALLFWPMDLTVSSCQ